MSETLFHPSCNNVADSLVPVAETHRLTVVCGLYAPHAGKLALVQGVMSFSQEPAMVGYGIPQGGIDPGESVQQTFAREIGEELGLETDVLSTVIGLPMHPVITGGRPRDGKPRKAYGVLCGIIDEQKGRRLPKLTPAPDEIALADWRSIFYAGEIFGLQQATPKTNKRGERNLRILDAIKAIDTSPQVSKTRWSKLRGIIANLAKNV